MSNPPFPPIILEGRCGLRNCMDFSAVCKFYLAPAMKMRLPLSYDHKVWLHAAQHRETHNF